jgi:hypothetical protein
MGIQIQYLILSFRGIWESDFNPRVKDKPWETGIGIDGMWEKKKSLEGWKSKILHLKALFTRDILTRNTAIKRYCNKNIFLSHGYLKAKVGS